MDADLAPERLRALPSWLLSQAAIRARREVSHALDELGAHRSHYAVLAALEEAGPQSQADLGRRCAIDRSDMHALVGVLEGEGYLVREPDPADRRRNRIAIAPPGRRRLRLLETRLHAAQDAALAPLSAHERAQLVALLDRVVAGGDDGVDGGDGDDGGDPGPAR